MNKLDKIIDVINSLCYKCPITPVCSKICEKYFHGINKILNQKLYKENWLLCDKDTCDDAAKTIARTDDEEDNENKRNLEY